MDPTTARTLSSRLADLLSREQVAMADFIVAVADFDRQRLWEPLGYTSLWHYLHRELGLSRTAAFYRKEAALLLQRLPEVEGSLRDGRLCLSSVAELAKVLTVENASEVLPRFFHRSAREAREVVAELAPRTDVPARVVVTQVEARQAVLTSEPSAPRAPEAAATPTLPTPTGTAPPPAPPLAPRPAVEPLTADLRRLHVTVSRRFLEKLEAAKDALSHARPGADAEAILEAGLDLILAQQAKRRAQVKKPRKARPPAADTATIPAEVRRAVWTRDGGRCQWRMDGGGICGSTHRPELDHIRPKARGGPGTIGNLRVLCDRHNTLAARLAYGERWMGRYAKSPSAEGGHPPQGASP
jgi:hypothetical protein